MGRPSVRPFVRGQAREREGGSLFISAAVICVSLPSFLPSFLSLSSPRPRPMAALSVLHLATCSRSSGARAHVSSTLIISRLRRRRRRRRHTAPPTDTQYSLPLARRSASSNEVARQKMIFESRQYLGFPSAKLKQYTRRTHNNILHLIIPCLLPLCVPSKGLFCRGLRRDRRRRPRDRPPSPTRATTTSFC